MKRLALVLFVGLMTVNTAGIVELLLPERCELLEAATSDEECSSTCIRCHCGRSFDTVVASPPVGGVVAKAAFAPWSPALPLSRPDDILHVPRPSAI